VGKGRRQAPGLAFLIDVESVIKSLFAGRIVLIRILAAFAPVVIVCLLLMMDKWPGQMPRGEIVQITQNRFYEGLPSLSPDGEWLAYRCDERGNGDICVSTIDGREIRNLTLASSGDESEPAVSPDGSMIAFHVLGRGLSLVSSGGGDITPLTTSGAQPAWTPDGRFIIYSVPAATGGDPRASVTEGWRVEISSGVRRRLSTGDFHEPAVSPGNRRIAYWGRPVEGLNRRRLSSGRADLWTIPIGGGAPVRVTDDAASETSPMWSADGRFLYYISNRNGSSGIWRIRISERSGRTRGSPELVRTPFSQPGHVTRSADGRRLAWSDTRPVERNLRVVFDADARRTRGAPVEIAPSEPDYENLQPSIDFSRSSGSAPAAPVTAPGASFPGYWSPDLRTFAGTAAGSVWLYSAATQSYDQFRPGKHPVWLNDSRRLIYADGGRLFIADTALRLSRELLSMPDQQLDHPRLSRDNLHLYFSHTGIDANLWVMTVRAH
jgi:Tol biopolymer transport system component